MFSDEIQAAILLSLNEDRLLSDVQEKLPTIEAMHYGKGMI